MSKFRLKSQQQRSMRLNRRHFLHLGGVGMFGLQLPELLAAEAIAGPAGKQPSADACIILHLNGGPSHLDMWDMKPNGPAESRGEFKPISTSLPGVQVCEHLPQLAGHMHRCTLVRGMHHSVNNSHAAAVYVSMTGHDRGEVGGGARPDDHPTPGAVVSSLRPASRDVVPHAVLPYKTKEGARGPLQPGFLGGWMGQAADPLWILQDPNAPDFSVPVFTLPEEISPQRLTTRASLLSHLNGRTQEQNLAGQVNVMTQLQRRALGVLTSSTTQQAFRIDTEPDRIRDSYGRNIYGQSALLARRLIEAGTRIVTLSWAPDANATWDTHTGNFKKLKTTLLPQFDAACSTLLSELAERDMLERTIVAVMGDFGRTPKINGNNAGRDHWNHCYTIMFAGGGFKSGFVFGASDRAGAYPIKDPTIPGDILATLYQCLGIDHHREINDRFNRPQRIVPNGNVVPALVV